jgi:hypothetical protein
MPKKAMLFKCKANHEHKNFISSNIFMELWNTVVQGRSERKWNTISIFTGLEFSITASKLHVFNIKSQRA